MAKRSLQGLETAWSMRWPVGLLAGLAVCLGVHYGAGTQAALLPVRGREHDLLAWCLLGACWLAALCCSPGYRQRRRRLQLRRELDALAVMPQRDFEQRVIEAFHRHGYVVEDSLRDDEGIADLLLYRNGATLVVQCRAWRSRRVDPATVRRVHALMLQQHAAGARILAIGDYTEEAWRLVVGTPVDLIHGEELLILLREAEAPQAPNVRPLSRPAQRRHARHQALRLVR
ncbi:restriction endonuclease [Fulvimonas sp. R45]|uniref:restriction endonuclease n=1 Tax=Fulvimonas sp. R45 TaxID=3045937 RepID=UPI00265EED32|nr:restriction endonuclease [Fulvimonas sp. R45]MDO1527836.1 restriction endonuclease [Fulvimonas sp. R45]